MKKLFAAIQVLCLIFFVCACTKEGTGTRSLLPEKEVIAPEKLNPLIQRMIYTSVDPMKEECDCIIEGEVVDEYTYESKTSHALFFYSKVKVLNVIKGEHIPEEIILAQYGLTWDSMEVKYTKGEHIISFLYQYEEGVPGAEEEYPCWYMSIAFEDGNFRVIQAEQNGKPVSLVQCFGAENILQYDGMPLSEFLSLLE